MKFKEKKSKSKNYQKGFAAFYLAILFLSLIFAISLGIYFLTINQQKILRYIQESNQAYYSAEAGIEDALIRLRNGLIFSNLYNFRIKDGTTTVEITNPVGGSRIITSSGNFKERVRKIQVVYTMSSQKISFFYGAQVDEGGIVMGNGSIINGNVFSNGNVVGSGKIENSIIVAGTGNKIEGIEVGENATVHTCKNSIINGNLTYVSGGSIINCQIKGSTSTLPHQIEPLPLPISQEQINKWKNETTLGGITTTDITISETKILGPIQIGTPSDPKNLIINNGATLIMKGTIYVTGNITFNPGSNLKLDSSYGYLSGVLISDGVVTVENNVIISGSGQIGSYLLLISTKQDIINPVINIRNNASGSVIYYANSGLIFLKNNMRAREITGYKVQIENNAIVEYESGLENALFTSGPGASWKVVSWREIE